MAKILITGGTGFLGTYLINHLVDAKKHEVSVVIRQSSTKKVPAQHSCHVFQLKENASNIEEIIVKSAPHCVVHLASCFLVNHTKDQIDNLIDSNVKFPTKLLEAMALHGVKCFINTGTYAEYFNQSPVYDPLNLYSATKRAFENILRFYINTQGLNAITLRLYDTYGPHDPRRKIITILRDAYRDKQTLDMSPGDQEVDLVYVEDVVMAYDRAIEYLLNASSLVDLDLAVASGESHTIKQVVKTLEAILGAKIKTNWGVRPYRDRENMIVRSDIAKTKSILGWAPQYTLKEGLTKLIEEEKLK